MSELRDCIENIANRTWRCGRMFSTSEGSEIEDVLRKSRRLHRDNPKSDYTIIRSAEDWEEFYFYAPTYDYPESYPCLGFMEYTIGGLGGDYRTHHKYYPPEGVDIETFQRCLDAGPPPPDE